MITNSLIADFLTCRQRAYLALTSQTATPTELDIHQQRILTRVRERFATAHEAHIVPTPPLDVLRPSDLAHLSSPIYATNQSFGTEIWHLTLDAIKILPPPSGTTKLPCVPIKASPSTAVSKNERLELCIIALVLKTTLQVSTAHTVQSYPNGMAQARRSPSTHTFARHDATFANSRR